MLMAMFYMDKMLICTAQLVNKKKIMQTTQGRNGSLEMHTLLWPLFLSSFLFKNTTTRPTQHSQKPDKHCWKMLDVALHQDKLANMFKQLTAHVEPFFPIPPVNTITKLRYMTISPITIVKRNIKYRTSKYSKNGICNENKQITIQNELKKQT
jgi:hypothetical protein